MNESEPLTGKILVVDGETSVAEVLSIFLEEAGHDVTSSLTGAEAMQLIQEEVYDVVLTDLVLPDISEGERLSGGLKLLEFAKQVDPSVEVIIITSHGTLNTIKQAMRLGAYDFIVIPPIWEEVIQDVASALVKRRLAVERAKLARDVKQSDESDITRLLQLYDNLASEMKQARADNQELFDLATRDGVTNLYNHRYFQSQLQNLMHERPLKQSMSLVMIDTDNFKLFNDRYGHLKGDKVLREIASVLTRNIRDTDIAARYGGDEFVVLLLETDKDRAIRFAERCVRLVSEHSFNEGHPEYKLTISAGVATCPEDATNPDELIDKADKRCYAAKQAGRNKVRAVESLN